MSALAHAEFTTTSSRGLRYDSAPMRLYRQAKRTASWDPGNIDFTVDRRDWIDLKHPERDLLLRLTALFQAGEESMTLDASPLLLAMAHEHRLEEQLFLATLLADEARHTEFFRRVLDDVCGVNDDLHHYHTPSFRALFYDELPNLMGRLIEDSSPRALAQALVAYTMIGEGVLSETGHFLYRTALRHRTLLPGVLAGLRRVERDEARHITFGVYLLGTLVAGDASIWQAVERSMNALLARSLGIVAEFFEPYRVIPFGLTLDDAITYAMSRFARRSARIERVRGGGRRAVEVAGRPGIEVMEWLAEQVAPLVVTSADAGAGALVLRVEHDADVASVFLTPEVLDQFLPEEIITALEERSASARLAREPGLRLACLQGSTGILVQSP